MVRGGGGWLFLLQLLCVRHNNAFSYESFAQKWMAMWRFFVWSNLGYLWPGEVEVVCGRRKCFGFKVLQRNFAQRLGSFLVGCVIAFSRVRWETLMDLILWTRIWDLAVSLHRVIQLDQRKILFGASQSESYDLGVSFWFTNATWGGRI